MSSSFRILRATRKIIAGDTIGEDNFHEDFVVPSFLLKVSEVWEPLADEDDGILVSEDFVIPLDDPIEDVRQLVLWLTREKGFKIHIENMEGLARLSDKYMIEHLHHDLSTFTTSLIITKYPPSVDLWEFAARYIFPELEGYCLENKSVYEELLKVLANPEQGIARFSKKGIPVFKLNILVGRVASAALENRCLFCPVRGLGSPLPRSPPGTSAAPIGGPISVNQM